MILSEERFETRSLIIVLMEKQAAKME